MMRIRKATGNAISTAALGIALISVFTGCSTDIHQRIVTTDNRQSLQDDVKNATDMSDDDKSEFDKALSRFDYQPYGKSVLTIISDQRGYDVRQHAAELARAQAQAALKQALDHDIEIYPYSISVIKGHYGSGQYTVDVPSQDSDTFVFLVQNTSSKYVRDFEADARLTNKGDDVLFTGTLQDAGGIPPRGSKRISIEVNGTDFSSLPNPQTVRDTDPANAIVHYTVNRIDYVDGTRVDRRTLDGFEAGS